MILLQQKHKLVPLIFNIIVLVVSYCLCSAFGLMVLILWSLLLEFTCTFPVNPWVEVDVRV